MLRCSTLQDAIVYRREGGSQRERESAKDRERKFVFYRTALCSTFVDMIFQFALYCRIVRKSRNTTLVNLDLACAGSIPADIMVKHMVKHMGDMPWMNRWM